MLTVRNRCRMCSSSGKAVYSQFSRHQPPPSAGLCRLPQQTLAVRQQAHQEACEQHGPAVSSHCNTGVTLTLAVIYKWHQCPHMVCPGLTHTPPTHTGPP